MSSSTEDTHTRILDVAWHMLVKRKGQDVRLDDIARQAKVSRQAVYLHFRTRADLLIATVRYVDSVLELDLRLASIYAAKTGSEIMDGMVEFWGNYIPEIYGLAKALLANYDTDKDAAAAWDDRMAALMRGCRLAIDLLHQEGRLSAGWEVEEATEAMWSLLAIAVWENLTIHQGWSNDKYIHRIQEIMRRTFIKQ